MKKNFILSLLLAGGLSLFAQVQLPPPVKSAVSHSRIDERARAYLSPTRIVWKYDGDGLLIKNIETLLKPGDNQAFTSSENCCIMRSTANQTPSILLDFGTELQGGISLITGAAGGVKVRIRFGESASEAMAEIDGKNGASNDHAMRDFTITLPWMGAIEVGNSGFRFVRIDLVDANAEVALREVQAIFMYRDIPYIGSFKSNDERLNQIWATGAYTVHLNMQDFLWDGIKRDRLVWHGDLYPEVMTISAVFGANEVVPKSLDYGSETTPLPQWMNGISAYSMWWMLNQRDWYYSHGNLDYLKKQREYVVGLLNRLLQKVDENGKEQLDGWRFLDWPTSRDPEIVEAGLQALITLAVEAGVDICRALGEKEMEQKCVEKLKAMRTQTPDARNNKQAAALLSLSGLQDAQAMNTIIGRDGAEGFSTFYGYFMLLAMAKAGDYDGALNSIRSYWGGMIDLGATTFWEDFDLKWMENAGRIDDLVPDDKVDVHAVYGDYCYKGFRHSFCHGWAAGPTAWLSRYVLGVEVIEPGCKTVRILPNLGDLEWVEGSYPTPYGTIKIRHEKRPDGKIASKIDAPSGVKVVR